MSIASRKMTPAEPSSDSLGQANFYLERHKPSKAIQALEKAKTSDQEKQAEIFHLQGCSHALSGEIQKAIVCYQNSLQKKPNYHRSYMALKNIYQWEILKTRALLDKYKAEKVDAVEKGKDTLPQIQKNLEDVYQKQASIYLSQAKTYFLYNHASTNISEFSELDAHLRDMQDIFKGEAQKEHRSSLLKEIRMTRRKLTKKYTKMLVQVGVNYAKQGKTYKAVDVLKEADDQLAKFFLEEKPTSKVTYMEADEEVVTLSAKIITHLTQYYKTLIEHCLTNKTQLENMESKEEVEEQLHKIEELIESWIQLRIISLWREKKMRREVAEEQSEMIPLYTKLLSHVPNSSQAGEFHYRLARCYLRQKNYKKSKEHAEKAKNSLGGYKVRELFQQLKNISEK